MFLGIFSGSDEFDDIKYYLRYVSLVLQKPIKPLNRKSKKYQCEEYMIAFLKKGFFLKQV